MWMISDPESVSCNCATSTSSGPIPANSYAARAASAVVPGTIGSSIEVRNSS